MTQKSKVVLCGSEHSYFTGKLRSYLVNKGIEHELVQTTMEVFRKTILPNVGWSVVPVVQVDGKIIQDTAIIMDYFEKLYPDERPAIPTTEKHRLVSAIFELFGDQWLTIAAMHFRWSFPEQLDFLKSEWQRSFDPPVHAFGSKEEKATGLAVAEKSMTRFSGMIPVLGVSESTIPGIESSYFHFLEKFQDHLKSHRYLLGNSPCIGDHGLIGPLFAHLYRDPVRAEHPHRVEEDGTITVLERLSGFYEGDDIPSTLYPLLQMFFDEHVPILLRTLQGFREYIESCESKQLREELPRPLGMAEYSIGGHKGSRMMFTFDLWKLQRVLDVLTPSGKRFLCDNFGPNARLFTEIDMSDCRLIKETQAPCRRSTLFLEKYYAGNSKL